MPILTHRTVAQKERRRTNVLRMHMMEQLRAQFPDMPWDHRNYVSKTVLESRKRVEYERTHPKNSNRFEVAMDVFVDEKVLTLLASAQIVSGVWRWWFHPYTSSLNDNGTYKEKSADLTGTISAELESARSCVERLMPTKTIY